MGLVDRIKDGISDTVDWTKEKVEAGAKLVGEALSDAKESAVDKLTSLVSTPVEAAQKVESKSTSILGLNSVSETVSYAWKKTTEMTSTLATVASAVSPTFAVARTLINIGNNTFKIAGTNDQVKILGKDESCTSVLSDSAWTSAIKRSAAQKSSSDRSDNACVAGATLDTEKVLNALPKKDSDDGSQSDNLTLTRHVKVDEWKRILGEGQPAAEQTRDGANQTAGDATQTAGGATQAAGDATQTAVIPEATTDESGITFHGKTGTDQTFVSDNGRDSGIKAGDRSGAIEIGSNQTKHKAVDGTEVTVEKGGTGFEASGPDGARIAINKITGAKEALDNGKGWREKPDGTQEWDVSDGQKVVFEPKEEVYKVYDRAGNLLASYPKAEVETIDDQIDENTRFSRSSQKVDEVLRRRQSAHAKGRTVGAAQDGLFMEDADGTVVVLKFDGNAYFQLDANTRIWKSKDNKYYIVEEGKEPEEILEGIVNERLQRQTARSLEFLQKLAAEGQFLLDDILFKVENGVVSATVQQKGTDVAAGIITATKEESTVERRDLKSTFNLTTRTVTLGEGAAKATIDLVNDVVETPFVKTDRRGTVIKRTNDWVGHDGTARLANGTEFTSEGDVHFADGTVIHKDGTIDLGEKTRLEAYLEEKEIKQAALVIQQASAIAQKARAKAAGGTITYNMITQLDMGISQIMSLMSSFSDNELVLAQLSKIMASLEGARHEACASFAANTQLRAVRDSALSSNRFALLSDSTYGAQAGAVSNSIESTFQPSMALNARMRPEFKLSA